MGCQSPWYFKLKVAQKARSVTKALCQWIIFTILLYRNVWESLISLCLAVTSSFLLCLPAGTTFFQFLLTRSVRNCGNFERQPWETCSRGKYLPVRRAHHCDCCISLQLCSRSRSLFGETQSKVPGLFWNFLLSFSHSPRVGRGSMHFATPWHFKLQKLEEFIRFLDEDWALLGGTQELRMSCGFCPVSSGITVRIAVQLLLSSALQTA